MKVLSLQPYFGGSHRNFSDGWVKRSRHQWTVLSLPDRHWKWRMRHAPLEFAKQIKRLQSQGQQWDAIFCTDMLDLATLKGIVDLPPVPITVYFHENQFAYPSGPNRPDTTNDSATDLHFAFTNFTTLVAADHAWFNSQFNFDTTLSGAEEMLKRFPDFQPLDQLNQIATKSIVQTPGVATSGTVASSPNFDQPNNDPPIVITWAARWEHDKGPSQLESFLRGLADHAIDFRLNVVGQSFRQQPAAFDRIKKDFADRIGAWGFQSAPRYFEILAETDVILSTANHEFFGLSVVEAISRGALPLLPKRLAYPEVIGAISNAGHLDHYLYDDIPDAIVKLQALKTVSPAHRQTLTSRCRERFNWDARAKAMDDALESNNRK